MPTASEITINSIEGDITRAGFARPSRHHREVAVALSPVTAEKDPRVVLAAVRDYRELERLDEVADALTAMIKALLPHRWLDDDAYRLVVAKIDAEPSNADLLRSGCLSIESHLGRPIAELPVGDLLQLLRSIDGGALHRTLLGRSVRHLYDDPRVWAGCGYEGVHGCRGEAPRDAIADADWLPEPAQA